jgi:hypothetical protein
MKMKLDPAVSIVSFDDAGPAVVLPAWSNRHYYIYTEHHEQRNPVGSFFK